MKDQERLLSYKTLLEGGEGEIVEKKSRFIAHTAPVSTEEEAVAFIEKIRKQYWDARHNCHAFVLGTLMETSRCSDDGEPPQTAGKPMLDVLTGAGLKNTVVVVPRYFGGTLLGTGGLVRAYTAAVQEGLKNSVIIEKKLCRRMRLTMDYTALGKVQYLAARQQLFVSSTDYTDVVTMELLIPEKEVGVFEKKLTELSGGKLACQEAGICYAAETEAGILTFED